MLYIKHAMTYRGGGLMIDRCLFQGQEKQISTNWLHCCCRTDNVNHRNVSPLCFFILYSFHVPIDIDIWFGYMYMHVQTQILKYTSRTLYCMLWHQQIFIIWNVHKTQQITFTCLTDLIVCYITWINYASYFNKSQPQQTLPNKLLWI